MPISRISNSRTLKITKKSKNEEGSKRRTPARSRHKSTKNTHSTHSLKRNHYGLNYYTNTLVTRQHCRFTSSYTLPEDPMATLAITLMVMPHGHTTFRLL